MDSVEDAYVLSSSIAIRDLLKKLGQFDNVLKYNRWFVIGYLEGCECWSSFI